MVDARRLDRFDSIRLRLGLVVVAAVLMTVVFNEIGRASDVSAPVRILASVVFALGLSQALAYGITAPLRAMARATADMAAGDYSARVRAATYDEVGDLARSFNRMAAELATMDRLRRDLVANVSHDLRTPIAALQARLENLVDGVEPADPAVLATMLKQVERLGRLVSQLLDLSRLESGTMPLDRRTFPARDLLDDVAREALLHDPAAAIEIVATADVLVDGDPERMHQVLANLLGNALRHSPPGETVRMSAHRAPGGVKIEVADHGPGIAADAAERVFDRFYRADTARAASDGGSGLGLAIALWIVDLHGGTIRPEANDPTGCRMVVELPA
jgi:signal transduction histidine kinase